MLKKLHVLFIKNFIGPFIGTFFIAMFLLLMQNVWKYLGDLVGKGLEPIVIAEFIFYFAIHIIPMALPLAILLTSIMVFGNMAEKYELVAMKSAGVSLLKAMRPMFVVALLIGIGTFYTANNLVPKANLSWGALFYDIMQKKPALNITDNVFFKDIKGYAIRVGKKHEDNQTIEDVLIYVDDAKRQGNNMIMLAEKGKMSFTANEQFLLFELENGKRYQEMTNDESYKKTMPHNIMSFDKYTMAIDMTGLELQRTDKTRFSEDYRMLNVNQLKTKIDSLDRYIVRKKRSLNKYLSPYFHEVQNEVDIQDTGVQARLNDLIQRSEALNAKRIKRERPTKPMPLAKSKTQETKRPERKITALSLANLSEDAMRNVGNAQRISKNHVTSANPEEDLRVRYLVEWYRKFVLAVSIVVLFFIGAPLGAIIKKGGFGLPFVISILLFITYYVLNMFFEKLVKEGTLDPAIGMWASTAILLPLAIFLTYKASTDSGLFERDFWKQWVPKWFKSRK